MSNKKHTKKDKNITPPSLNDAVSDDVNAWDMVNRYGTYNTQNTNGIQNDYPQIAQGLSDKTNPKRKKK